MAASVITAAQLELINSLSPEEIPIKLRCAICSKLAANAFRLPCCDQAICESCQSTLPSTCPVCEHSPLAAEDCKPNKSLRTTIKVFLRTEEKKREALRLKESKEATPVTSLEAVPTSAEISVEPSQDTVPLTEETPEQSASLEQDEAKAIIQVENEQTAELDQDEPQPSIEEIEPGQESVQDADTTNSNSNPPQAGDENASADVDGQTVDSRTGDMSSFDPSSMGGFPNMGMGGDFNQMQMMMAMQNGMGTGGFGGFPMMGVPGMNMDPLMMQNMFMNSGFGAGSIGGMNGMNGMNTGMGMGGFDGGMGGGTWDGHQSWNDAPINFNPNASGMMGHGDFGAHNNSGFAQNATGFNQQGNYGRPDNHYNDYQNNFHGNNHGYQARGRGRGRGGFGRNAFGHGSHDAFSQQFPQQFGSSQQPVQSSETAPIPTGPKVDTGNVDEFGREIRPASESIDGANNDKPETVLASESNRADPGDNQTIANGPTKSTPEVQEESNPKPIQSVDGSQAVPFAPVGPNGATYNGHGYGSGNRGYTHGNSYGGRGGFHAMQPPKPVDVPVNAPTGPKAMREGNPNTSFRGRGLPISVRPGSRTNGGVNGSIAAEPEQEGGERDVSRSRSRDRVRDRSKDRKRSASRTRSRSRDQHRRKHRHRSESLSEDEKETGRRRERRRERRRRREEDEGRDESRDEAVDDKREEGDRSRTASPSDYKRSSQRSSRRDRDKYRERDRESDREHKSSSHKHRSHRSHRDRSRSRDRDRERDREKDRESRHRHSRRGSPDPNEERERESSKQAATNDGELARRASVVSNSMEIKGASSRRKNPLEEIAIPTGPRSDRNRDREKEKSSRYHSSSTQQLDTDSRSVRDKRVPVRDTEKDKGKGSAPPVQDPHTIEREARNRERLLKEAQRMAGFGAGAGGRKRSRDDGDGDRKGKKKGRRSGHVVEDDEEARIARLEAERESARWE